MPSLVTGASLEVALRGGRPAAATKLVCDAAFQLTFSIDFQLTRDCPKPLCRPGPASPMSTRQDTVSSRSVDSRDDLIAWIAAGSKPPQDWRIGTEHEKFLFHADTLRPVPYEGERGV